MFLIIWGFRRRIRNLGVVGPFTCPTCSWIGTFWLRQVQRQLRIYYIPVMPWTKGRHFTVCRNCGTATEISRETVESLVASAQPIGAPDPFGPQPSTPPAVAPSPVPAPGGPAAPAGHPPEPGHGWPGSPQST